ncbi:hypothetical protein QBC46DRAFT_394732 [Diplogelasinospora grovesii]|uniref:F-box domain-containing protein n=1 Tax=Diplogelasinospora grovesii TaxID=303347 RepID=A0AAN6S1P9_9PEZI|nr:hypothetical protein QBC46DRAFT_394732 [Diplogelasinospora grovesii]
MMDDLSYDGVPNAPNGGGTAVDMDMDPLIAPTFHNLTRSPLCSLPDDILLRVMSQADDVSLFCLRRTSRIFLRLFGDRRFRRVHDESYFTWPWPARARWTRERVAAHVKPHLRPLLQRDLYCETCRNFGPEAKRRLRTELIYCSGCDTKHPAGLFSYDQRHGPPNTRICIGREGHVRICDHLVLTCADVERWLATGRPWLVQKCCDRSHRNALNPSPCGSEDHAVHVHFGAFCRVRSCRDLHAQGPQPYIAIQWKTHITLPGVGLSNGIDGADLRRQVDWLRNTASFIFAERPGKYPPELQAFDPNSCSCVHSPGLSSQDRWGFPSREGNPVQCVRHGAAMNTRWFAGGVGLRMEEFLDYLFKCYPRHFFTGWYAKKCGASAECVKISYEKLIPLSPCPRCHPISGWVKQAFQPASADWFMALDPDSYSLQQDRDSYGDYWCDNRTCLNYHLFHNQNPRKMALRSPGIWGRVRALFKFSRGG